MSGDRPARWTHRHLDRLTPAEATTAPAIDPAALPRILPGHDLWDLWPVQEEDGSTSVVDGRELWMSLSAPALGHPEERHDRARIRLLGRTGDEWADLGNLFPDGASLGSREWSGSAVRRPDGSVSVYYTAAGRHGESRPTYRQRVAEARLSASVLGAAVREASPHGGSPRGASVRGASVRGASSHGASSRGASSHGEGPHREILRSDGHVYLPADEDEGAPGRIRAFRDPGWFRDPADGRDHLLVAASTAWKDTFTGAIALATSQDGTWTLRPPLLVADGVNHELERPHVVVHDSRYYLFFSAQRHTFHPAGRGPTGLYGFAAPALTGPYEPLNESGLVIGNPAGAPDQAYAWLVLPDLRVVSFANYRGSDLRSADAAQARAGFGGTLAPTLKLALNGLRTTVVPEACDGM